MDKEEAIVTAKKFLDGIRDIVSFEKAYLFGSYATGTPRRDSDIDVGIYTAEIGGEYFSVLKNIYRVRRNIDPRIEPHLFIRGADRSGFAEEVERIGVRID